MSLASATDNRFVRALVCLLSVQIAGCGAGPLTSLRFENRDPVWRVDDRQPIALPAELEVLGLSSDVESQVRTEILHDMAVYEPRLADNINSLGEVPDSTWFENRIGRQPMSAEEIARGPGGAGPDLASPWTVVSAKLGGTAPGFVIEDARGDRYLVKLDPLQPEAETGAEVVVQRLLWAAGYHVPENNVVYFPRTQLELSPEATRKRILGDKVALTAADLDTTVGNAPPPVPGPGGVPVHRAMASKYLSGVPVGGYPMSGTRADDGNDLVPHEHRRDLRAQALFFAWLGHTDVKQKNTLDMWIELEPDSGRGYLRHHLLDFGKGLGVWGQTGLHEHDGWSAHFDYRYAFASLLALGLWRRPWENLQWPQLRGVGRFEAVDFNPASYDPANPYTPFLHADRFDRYWAAKIISAFTAEHIVAAVQQGQYSDPRATAYLSATLIARQRKVLRYGFGEVGTVDRFRVEATGASSRLCAQDLSVAVGLAEAKSSRYVLEAYNWEGRAIGWQRELAAAPGGELCAGGLRPPSRRDGYTMVVYRTFRGDDETPAVIAHLARHPDTGVLRVIGIQRR